MRGDPTTAVTRPLAASAGRLNAFALPSTTDARFALLVVAAISASVYVFYILLALSGIGPLAPALDLALSRCGAAGSLDLARLDAISTCMQPTFQGQAVAITVAVVAMALVAALIFIGMPVWRIRRGRLVPFTRDDSAAAHDCLVDLSHQVGLPEPPMFRWNPLNLSPGGMAFGGAGRTYVAITGGLVVLFATDPAAFRAIALHELSHVRNGDVWKTYLAIAIWWAFVGTALVPLLLVRLLYVVSLFSAGSGNAGLTQIDREATWISSVAALTVVVYLLRNAVLRSREAYADLRASTFEGIGSELDRVLGQHGDRQVGWMTRLFGRHPLPKRRRLLLEDSDRLFGLDSWEAFGCGCCAGIAYGGIALLVDRAEPFSLWFLGDVVSGLVIGGLVVGVVGVAVWRAVLRDLARGDRVRSAHVVGVVMALGLLAGLNLGFEASLIDPGYHVLGIGFSGADLIWDALLVLTCVLILGWLRTVARQWLVAAAGLASPRLPLAVGLATATLLIGSWFSILTMLSRFDPATVAPAIASSGGASTGVLFYLYAAGTATAFLAEHPLTSVTVAVVWALPLCAGLWRRPGRAGDGQTWVYLDRSTAPPALTRRSSDPRMAVRVGLLGGVAYLCLSAYVYAVVLLGDQIGSAALLVVTVNIQETLTLVAPAVVAVVAWNRAPFARVPHALLAVSVAAVLVAAGFIPVHHAVGLLDLTAQNVLTTLVVMLNLGAIIALLVAAPTAWWTRAARERPRRSAPVT